jgi:ubiquinol-cytochrome c reductase cytochrome c1 subunit
MRIPEMRTTFRLGLVLAVLLGMVAATNAQSTTMGTPLSPKVIDWPWLGPLGMYDKAQLQRGFQVYKEVCSACHSMNLVSFHSLAEPGGPSFTDAEMKALAASYKIPADPNDKGDIFDDKGNRLTRAGTPADHFPPPFANDNAARAANNGALPPDQSVLVKAREGGPDYVYSICTGYGKTPPAGFTVMSGKYYNPYFDGWNISMPPPLSDNSVTYSDGTKATVDQECRDIASFLTWAAEPKQDERKHLGFEVLLFLILFSGLCYFTYRRIWRDMH